MVKRVINEGIIQNKTPEEFAKEFPNTNGTFAIVNGYFEVKLANGKQFTIGSFC